MFLSRPNGTLDGEHSNTSGYLHEGSTLGYEDRSMNGTEGEFDTHWTFELKFVAFTILLVIAVLFNILSLCALSRTRSPRSVHHTLLMNLASCDIVGAILLWMYYNSPYIFPKFPITTLERCLFITVILLAPFILSLCTSSLSLLILAANQYVAICSPLFSATRITRGRAIVVIITTWLISATLAMIPGILTVFKAQSEQCNVYVGEMAVTSIEICGYVLAGLVVIVVVLYISIYREVLRYRRRIPKLQATASFQSKSRSQSASSQSGTSRRSETEHNYKAFITTILLAGTLIIFWLPFMIFNFLSAHLNLDHIPDGLIKAKFYFIDFLPMLNFIVDPVIYGVRIKEIRLGYHKVFAKLLPCCVSEPSRQPASRSNIRFTTLDTSL